MREPMVFLLACWACGQTWRLHQSRTALDVDGLDRRIIAVCRTAGCFAPIESHSLTANEAFVISLSGVPDVRSLVRRFGEQLDDDVAVRAFVSP